MGERSVLSLPQATLDKLVLDLERRHPRNKHWRGLAAEIGFTARHTAFIEDRNSGSSKTCMLMTAWDWSGRSSVNKLVIALFCLDRADCLRALQDDRSLADVDFSELEATASRIKDDYAEREKYFPPFSDDYPIGHDVWPAAAWPAPCPPQEERLPCSQPLRESQAPAMSARSPEEECPSLSVTASEAPDVAPSREKVFISYYPDSSTTPQVEEVAKALARQGLTVRYANEREMMDVEFKTSAIASSYNVVVLCTQRYCREDQDLSANPSLPSKIRIDRTMIRDIYFSDQKRMVLVSLDGAHQPGCVPQLYRNLRLYRFPSQLTDLRHCLADIPKFVAPTPDPEDIISIQPTKIAFRGEVREYRARHNIPSPQNLRSLKPTPIIYHPPPQTKKLVPRRIPNSKKSLFQKLFNKGQ
jgi:hypothetical protein